MSSFTRLAFSSIGKKVLMAATGAGLCGFLVTHLAGNLILFAGPKAYNAYAHSLESNPLLLPAEFALLGLFLAHIALAMLLTMENGNARPVAYAYEGYGFGSGKGGRNPFNWTMLYTGLYMLAFVLFHLLTFKFTDYWKMPHPDAQGYRDFYHLVQNTFQDSRYAWFYVVSMVILGFHLRHGFLALFRSTGLYGKKYTEALDLLAMLFAGAIAGGYIALPLWFNVLHGGM